MDQGDAEDHLADGGSVWADIDYPPPGTRQAARQALQQLLTVWCQRLLPGWAVTFKPIKRRGPRKKESEHYVDMLVSEYKNLLDKLNKRNYMDFKLKEGESRERLIVRTAKLVQALY